MAGINKKPPLMASDDFIKAFEAISKSALVDALWCAAQLGTNETSHEIEAQAARNAVIALATRGDKVPSAIESMACRTIDADPKEN